MNLVISLYLLLTVSTSISQCQFWTEDYQYNSLFGASDLFHISGLEMPTFHDNSFLYNNIIENQIRAEKIISDIQFNNPPPFYDTRGLLYPNDNPKSIYFSDYPHTKALVGLQWKRLRNRLLGHKLGSLRPNSPFYRP